MFFSRLEATCKQRNTTVYSLVNAVGGNTGSIDGWKKKGSTPHASLISKMATHLNVSTDFLLERTDIPDMVDVGMRTLDPDESELIDNLRSADVRTRSAVITMASALIMKPKDPQNLQEEPAAFSWSNDVKYHHNEGGRGRADRRKPVEGKAAAGAPIATVPEEDLSVVVPAKYLSEEYFIVQAQGDSMTGSGIDSGDFCVFQRDAYQDDGAVMYVQLDGATDLPDGAIKRVYRRGKQVELRSTNPAYAPMLYPASDVALNGVFVSVIKPERRAD